MARNVFVVLNYNWQIDEQTQCYCQGSKYEATDIVQDIRVVPLNTFSLLAFQLNKNIFCPYNVN